MHFIDTNAVAHKLRQQQMFAVEKISYFIGMVALIVARVGVFNLLPTIYFFIFTMAKQRLEFEAREANLTIDVPTTSPEWFWIVQIGIICAGLISCYIANQRGDGKHFIERFVCLSWPTMIRIMLALAIIYGALLAVGGNYFFKELATLSATEAKKKGIPVIRFFLKAVKQLNILKTIGDNLAKLARAKAIFADISQFSINMYYAAHGLSVLATLWYFRSLRKKIRSVSRKT